VAAAARALYQRIDAPEALALKGKAAVAQARLAYQLFLGLGRGGGRWRHA
jgi:hypothetical protein